MLLTNIVAIMIMAALIASVCLYFYNERPRNTPPAPAPALDIKEKIKYQYIPFACYAFCSITISLSTIEISSCEIEQVIAIHTVLNILFFNTLFILCVTDFIFMILPDSITLTLVWAGLILSVMGYSPLSPEDAIWGAVAGYLPLFILSKVYFLVRGVEGMGHGDFKLLAAIGAWQGASSIPFVLFAGSVLGLITGLLFQAVKKDDNGQFPFGIALSLGAVLSPFLSCVTANLI